MEDLSGSCADHLIPEGIAPALALLLGLALLGPVGAGAEAPDALAGESFGFACGVACPPSGDMLLGAWHVLVHYEDAGSTSAARERWDDRAWVFEREGDRLRWTEYPIVVFDSESGRFERDAVNRAFRIIDDWRPDEAQRADIEDGLAVDERSVASASLQRSEGSWVSAPDRATSSASTIRYVESWRVDSAARGPIFVREEALRSERAGDLSGVTIYTTREVADGGRLLRGDFERDGTQRGTFAMTRAAGVHGHGN